MKCSEDNYCVICPYRYCVDEEKMLQLLIENTKRQVERWGLHWINIWFEEEDKIALKAFAQYRKWLKEYGFEGNEPSYKKWIVYTSDTHKPCIDCGCHSGIFYFHEKQLNSI